MTAPTAKEQEAADREARRKQKIEPRSDVRRNIEAQDLITTPAMIRALEIEEGIIWPKGQQFMVAEGVAAIANLLIRRFHRELKDYKILYLFREKMKSRDRVTLGKASKADPKLEFFTEAVFVMEINHGTWIFAPADAKVALIDHELSHFGIEADDAGVKTPVLIHHDIEEFGAIIQRWGLWKQDVKVFAHAIQLALPLGETDNEAHEPGPPDIKPAPEQLETAAV